MIEVRDDSVSNIKTSQALNSDDTITTDIFMYVDIKDENGHPQAGVEISFSEAELEAMLKEIRENK